MLDGQEGDLIYETDTVDGWRFATFTPRLDLIAAHTLADPSRLRIVRGGTHLEGVTGRYDMQTGHSDLFSMVAADLLSVIPSMASKNPPRSASEGLPLLVHF